MSNFEHEEENRAFAHPFLAALTSDEEWEEILHEVEGYSEEHLPPALAEARVAVARLAQEKPLHGRGLLTTLWLLASPVFAAMTLVNLYGGQWNWLALNAFFLLTSRHLYNVTDQNEQMRTALNVHEATPKWIGSLAEVLDWPAPRAQKIATHLLTMLLPYVTQDDWELLTPAQRYALYQRLDPRYIKSEPDLILALLKGIQNLQDTEALPAVERLSGMRAWTTVKRNVRLAAMVCQDVLEMRENEDAARISQEALREAGEAVTVAPVVPPLESVPAELESLITTIREERAKAMQPGMRLPYLIGSWCVIVPFTGTQAFLNFSLGHPTRGALWLLLSALGSQLHRITLLPGRSEEMKQLAQYDSVKGVGFLAEVLEWPDTSAQLAARDALVRLLPRLKSSDSPLLNERQRACLYRRLRLSNSRKDDNLIFAILKSLEQVGDLNAVGYVKKLSESRPLTAAQKRIVEEAQECLPYLYRRADLNEGSQYLLRASHAVDYAPEQLLRPSSETAVPSEELLRPRGHTEEE